MRKILEAMNASGMFGPVKESSLDMLSQKERDAISDLLIRTALTNWDGTSCSFTFEMRGEICKASLRDTWDDNLELSVRIEISKYDLYVSGFYYPGDKKITHTDPRGKRELAEKFLQGGPIELNPVAPSLSPNDASTVDLLVSRRPNGATKQLEGKTVAHGLKDSHCEFGEWLERSRKPSFRFYGFSATSCHGYLDTHFDQSATTFPSALCHAP